MYILLIEKNVAAIAGPPSPENPAAPVPAIVVIIPVLIVTLRITLY